MQPTCKVLCKILFYLQSLLVVLLGPFQGVPTLARHAVPVANKEVGNTDTNNYQIRTFKSAMYIQYAYMYVCVYIRTMSLMYVAISHYPSCEYM